MPRFINKPQIMDAALAVIRDNATLITLNTQVPTTRANAVGAYHLGSISVDDTDFTIENGIISTGRRIVIAAQAAVPIATTGTITYVSIVGETHLYYSTTTPALEVTAGDTVDIGSFYLEIPQPVAP